MKWHARRFRSALKLVFEIRREFRHDDGEANVLLYRVDAANDGIAIIGSFATRPGRLLLNEPGASAREFAIAIETCDGGEDMDAVRGTGVRLWFGDQALCRAMGQPIDGMANRLEFGSVEAAAKVVKELMSAEASFVALRGDAKEED